MKRIALRLRQLAGMSLVACAAGSAFSARAEVIWTEGEKPAQTTVTRHPWWYEKVHRNLLSGGDMIAHYDDTRSGEASYHVTAKKAGDYDFWVRANPIQSKLSYQLNAGPWKPIDTTSNVVGSENIAEDNAPDLRFLGWMNAGKVALKAGENTVTFRFDSPPPMHYHGFLDCFVLADEPFTPDGILKPDQAKLVQQKMQEASKGWIPFAPKADTFQGNSGIDLRSLNEKFAGEHGNIVAKDGKFILGSTGEPVRFWAVNGPPHDLSGEPLKHTARWLAKYGVNLARLHGSFYDESGNINLEEVKRKVAIVKALKAEGIYSHLSIYFPLWLKPKANTPWLQGYDGTKTPFATLYFNKDFQAQYRKWWETILTTPAEDGSKLIDDPAVMSAEIINEDSYFFWTFSEQNIPDLQLRILEKQFGEWLAKKYGSLDAAFAKWGGAKLKRDTAAEGRAAFRPLYDMFTQKSPRDLDTAGFLAESQRQFYEETTKWLRSIGFKGMITASNWTTANNEVMGPLERWTYTPGDYIDRHGYFDCYHQGEAAEWSMRDGHLYADRSAYKFENSEPGKPKVFVHPAMDITYDNKPTMISETTWVRPNRYRSEGPLFYAAYGALQDDDAIVHFAFDSSAWAVKPNFFMQPWTLSSPAMLGQFPATALIYRKGMVGIGDTLAEVNLSVKDVLALKGTPLPQDAAFDELRLKDVPKGVSVKPGNVIDPLIHLAGVTKTNFVQGPSSTTLQDLSKLIDRKNSTVTSSNQQVKLNYSTGLLMVNAPMAQAISGMLKDAGKQQTRNMAVESDMELGHIILVSLDNQPIDSSKKMLLQVMSEEQNSEWKEQPATGQIKKIISIGRDPWKMKELRGTITFTMPEAATLKTQPLDFNGYPAGDVTAGDSLRLQPGTIYYLVTR